MTVQIITIDGPSGSGKGTLAAKLAAHYQFHLLELACISGQNIFPNLHLKSCI